MMQLCMCALNHHIVHLEKNHVVQKKISFNKIKIGQSRSVVCSRIFGSSRPLLPVWWRVELSTGCMRGRGHQLKRVGLLLFYCHFKLCLCDPVVPLKL